MTRKYKQNGAATVELAIIMALIFLPLVFVIIEFSFLLYDKSMITNASREGARAGIVYSYPDRISEAEIENVVNNYCQDHLVSFGASSVGIEFPDGGTAGKSNGDPLTVRVTYPYVFLVLPDFVTGLVGNITLTSEAIMRME
jgi:Flp pilus assembly protein TadG